MWCFCIDPGGQNSHPGAPGSDSGGETHQEFTFLKNWCLSKVQKITKNPKEIYV